MFSFRKNITAGLFAVIPLWISWLVIAFLLGLTVDLVEPITKWIVNLSRSYFPGSTDVLEFKIVQYSISVLLFLVIIYWLGLLTTHFVGRHIKRIIDQLLERIPLVGKIYSGTKKVVDTFQEKSSQSRRVVLIEYPHPGMKTVGLVTKTLTDRLSGKSLLAV